MKLHRNLCLAIAEATLEIFVKAQRTDQIIDQYYLRNRKWGARDRNFFASTLYDIVRYYRLLCHGVSIPMVAALPDGWSLTAAALVYREHELMPWAEWEHLDSAVIQQRMSDTSLPRAVSESIPDWMDTMGHDSYGNSWDSELHALNQPAALCLRVNTLQATREQVGKMLEKEGIPYQLTDIPTGIVIPARRNVAALKAYQDGWYEIQDISSQTVAPLLQVAPGMTVIDACSGAGGKTLHIAALMENKGKIIALDIHQDKLDKLTIRAQRAGVRMVNARIYEHGLENDLANRADRLLLDVPCTGMGILRRDPDTKWRLTPESVLEVIALQQDLLHRYSNMLKRGGIMVYATCSVLREENEAQITQFLSTHATYTLLQEQRISPATSGYDGFYMAVLKKG